jgi:hypothetical protein
LNDDKENLQKHVSGIAKYEKKTAAEVVSRYYTSPLNVCGGLAEAQN